MRTVYMDYAATTYVKPEVLNEMMPYFTEKFGNPSSFYSLSRETNGAISKAREKVAKALNCKTSEVYFTGGGSESDNWAIKGIAYAHQNKGNHIITSKIEHHAVLNTCEYLEKKGFKVTYLDVDKNGFVDVKELEKAITDKTILVSIMFANNEIGTIQPIKEIGAICREREVLFHTDAVQAVGNVHVDIEELNIDLLSLSGHKIYGPKGIGALYVRQGVRIENLIHGGGQERARRAGTENVAAVVGIGRAIELAVESLDSHSKKMTELRDRLIEGLLQIPHSNLNGPEGDKRLPGNVNIGFEFIKGESILLSLDLRGICASSGSACASGSLEASHVLTAIGVSSERDSGSLRLTIGDGTTEEDIDYVIESISSIIQKQREVKGYGKNI